MSGFSADHPGAEVRVSPNFGPRIGVAAPDMIILHYTGMPDCAGAEAWLCNTESQVSSHYIVHEDGRIVQMVREGDRAWHAGRSSWKGATDVNSLSVGIEICNPGHSFGYPDFPEVQIGAVIELCGGIALRHGVTPDRVLAHSDVAPGRKVDPGEKFPWQVLFDAGIGHWVAPTPAGDDRGFGQGSTGADVEVLQSMLALYGYGVEITGHFDQATKIVLEAFQRHFRPERVDGLADSSSLATLHRLLAALPSGQSRGRII